MTDEARIARLTELARRVWPEAVAGFTSDSSNYSVPTAYVESTRNGSTEISIDHPRALDALEAALLVLADETPAWVEQLAKEWECAADIHSPPNGEVSWPVDRMRRDCARELRERAKRGEP